MKIIYICSSKTEEEALTKPFHIICLKFIVITLNNKMTIISLFVFCFVIFCQKENVILRKKNMVYGSEDNIFHVNQFNGIIYANKKLS